MAIELKKQESLLAQIHSEMSVGTVPKHREEQLWEVIMSTSSQLRLQIIGFTFKGAKDRNTAQKTAETNGAVNRNFHSS